MAFVDFALIFFTALISSVLIVPILIRFAHFKQMYDFPDYTQTNSRRVHLKPIPRIGGIAIVGSFFFTLYIWQIPFFSKIIYVASALLFFLGLVDDLKNISAKFRLLIQFCVATFTVLYANLALKWIVIDTHHIFILPHYVGAFISIFIIIGAVNAMNMIDGLDGLASGIGLISVSIFSYFLFLHAKKHELLLVFTVPMLGCIIGFLKYNTYPSRIFMGDSGSNWLGFMMGTFILILANSTTHIPFISILLAFSIPIFDTAHVIILRLMKGRNPMMADDQHFHHVLIKLGFTHSQSVGIIYFLMLLFGVLGMIPVALKQYSLWWISWVGMVALIFMLATSIQLKRILFTQNILSNISSYKKNFIKKYIYTLVFFIENIHRYIIYTFLLITGLSAFFQFRVIDNILAFACFAMLLKLFFQKSCALFSSCILVIISTMIFAISSSDNITVSLLTTQFKLKIIYNVIFMLLFLTTAFLCSTKIKRKYFVITPTDILLILVPTLILMMPDTWAHDYGLRLIIVRGLILFGALRTFGKKNREGSLQLIRLYSKSTSESKSIINI